ncbi:MAG TPA: hypothetical protein VF169_27720 [Albitalea sp.]|uniref:hypothetical protein n=1 Tax=Piscinibacter sp. TaxID=1903157 RepID=UPI002ED60D2E
MRDAAPLPVPVAWFGLALLVAVALAYANAFAGGFQFDDFNVIVRESSVQSVSAWWRAQPGIRPLLKLSVALNHVSGWGLAGFHAVNLAVHAGNTLWVAWLLRRLASRLALDEEGRRRTAWLATAVFALHPVQTEAVTYVSGRSTSLAAFFALASIALWLQGRDRGSRALVFVASPLALGAALACKEFALVVPAALWLCAGVLAGDGAWWRSAWRDSRLHLLLVAAALIAACAVPRYRELLAASLAARELGDNLLAQAQAVSYLAGQLVRLDGLNADPALIVETAPGLLSMAHAAVWIALLVAGAWGLRRHRVAAFALLWFLLWLAPTNSLLPRLDLANERQLYLALVGPAFLAAWALVRCVPRGVQAWLVPMILLVLGCATWERNRVYADEIAYWGDVARKSPHNARAFANLGHALALDCRSAQARRAFEVALALDPALVQPAVRLRLMREGELPDGGCARVDR